MVDKVLVRAVQFEKLPTEASFKIGQARVGPDEESYDLRLCRGKPWLAVTPAGGSGGVVFSLEEMSAAAVHLMGPKDVGDEASGGEPETRHDQAEEAEGDGGDADTEVEEAEESEDDEKPEEDDDEEPDQPD